MNRFTLKVYTDGACKVNPGRGGWGVVYYLKRSNITISVHNFGGKMKTTNQEMELTAFLEALKLSPKNSDLLIHIDSKYVLNSLIKGNEGYIECKKRKMGNDVDPIFTGWLNAWIKNGWKKKDGKTISHEKLWKDVVCQCKNHLQYGSTIKCIWVKGHSGNKGNDMADILANLGVPKRN